MPSVALPPMFKAYDGKGDLCENCREKSRRIQKYRLTGGWQACPLCDAPEPKNAD